MAGSGADEAGGRYAGRKTVGLVAPQKIQNKNFSLEIRSPRTRAPKQKRSGNAPGGGGGGFPRSDRSRCAGDCKHSTSTESGREPERNNPGENERLRGDSDLHSNGISLTAPHNRCPLTVARGVGGGGGALRFVRGFI